MASLPAAAASLTTIGATSTTTTTVTPYLSLGSVVFGAKEMLRAPTSDTDTGAFSTGGQTNLETPDELKIGVTQKLVTHDLIGGTRVAQSLGYSFKDVTWTGRLFGNILPRARALQQMAANGREQRLKFVDERYDVVVLEFEVTYRHRFYYEYSITVRPIRDVSGRFTKGSSSPANVDQAALAQLTRAQALLVQMTAANAAAATLQTSLNSAATVLAGVSPIESAIGSNTLNTVIAAIGIAIAAASVYQTSTGNTYGNGHAVATQSYLDTLTVLQANVKRGQSPSTMQVVGGNLVQIASQVYGDPSYADQLRVANGLDGNRLPTDRMTTLSLPALVLSTS